MGLRILRSILVHDKCGLEVQIQSNRQFQELKVNFDSN